MDKKQATKWRLHPRVTQALQANKEKMSMAEAMTYLKQHTQEIVRKAEAEAASVAAELAEATEKLEAANGALQAEKDAFSNLQVHI
jgi:predicted metal-binding transcription factor (methanogenesis marker protein 9)